MSAGNAKREFDWNTLYVRVVSVFGILIAGYILVLTLIRGGSVTQLIPVILTLFIAVFSGRIIKGEPAGKKDALPFMELLVLSACFLTAGSLFILNVRLLPESDPKEVVEIAEQLLAGALSTMLPGEYMYRYPYQSGVVLYVMAATVLAGSANTLLVEMINLCAWIGMLWLFAHLAAQIWEDYRITKLVPLAVSLFLPALFDTLDVYGISLGIFLSLAAVDCAVYSLKKRKTIMFIPAALFLTAGIFFKSNSKIWGLGILAVLAVELLSFLAKKDLKGCLGVLIGVVLIAVSIKITIPAGAWLLGQVTGTKMPVGVPGITWVAMGLEDGDTPGGFNGLTVKLYEENGYDTEATSKAAWDHIFYTLGIYRNDPARGFRWFTEKQKNNWSDPTYTAARRITGHENNATEFGKRYLKLVKSGLKKGQFLRLFMAYYHTWAYVGALCAMLVFLVRPGRSARECLLLTIFVGGFLCHVIWEGKPQYGIPYTLVLTFYAIFGYAGMAGVLRGLLQKR